LKEIEEPEQAAGKEEEVADDHAAFHIHTALHGRRSCVKSRSTVRTWRAEPIEVGLGLIRAFRTWLTVHRISERAVMRSSDVRLIEIEREIEIDR